MVRIAAQRLDDSALGSGETGRLFGKRPPAVDEPQENQTLEHA